MKRLLTSMIMLFVFAVSDANAWFFFLPGSVTGKISDSITGDRGENCVAESTNVGDPIRLPDGSIATVKSLSGKSIRCTNPEQPIRALLVPSDNSPHVSVNQVVADPESAIPFTVYSKAFNSKAGIELPNGWSSSHPSKRLEEKGYFFYATNMSISAYLTMTTTNREDITDVLEFAKARRASQVAYISNEQQSDIEQLQVNGMPAWRFVVRGKLPNNNQEITFMSTMIDSGTEVLELKSWIYSEKYYAHRDELNKLAFGIRFSGSPPTQVTTSPPATVTTIQSSNKLPPNGKSPSERLRELKELYKDGLISEKDYESKKKEILELM